MPQTMLRREIGFFAIFRSAEMGWFDKGKQDQQQNRGPRDMTGSSHQDRNKYDAGRDAAKKEQQQKK